MAKNKLDRFRDIAAFNNVLELTDFQDESSEKPFGAWKKKIFNNDKPLILELACGKGGYTLALGRRNPHKNYLGIDIKGARIWKGAKIAREEGMGNIRFLRIYIDHLAEYFSPGEVDDIWITFPDPYLKHSDRSKRLTSPKFLRIYRKVLSPDGNIRLKTDSNPLFKYTKKVISDTQCQISDVVEDIYRDRPDDDLLTIKTDYERRHLKNGKSISYIKFSLPADVQ